ncbi:hypothetical protein AYR46_02940 [Sphingobium yanoikuyae]|uniref:SGNH/GDSL hydrolase family protein n=1 Tax=Sphingobium yanoikuyae TaxID=13690 RepID=UPI0007A7610E|nr:SGNH/GDSL hydrolase family protein [Sphingobium yanoikuyae]KZC82877.1 hypothetical protein AYR46_02940 [Sphingobium yanoikuyae]
MTHNVYRARARGMPGPGLTADEQAAVDRAVRAPITVPTFADRDGGIPLGERYDGLLVKVVEADQWFQWDASASAWVTPFEYVDHTVLFASPPVLDQGLLYFPEFRLLRYRQNGYGTFYVPATGGVFAPLVASATAEVRRHIFDIDVYLTAVAGGATEAAAAQSALSTVIGNAEPLVDNATQVILAVTINGKIVDNRGRPFVGDVPGGAIPNQFRYGKLIDDAPFIYPGLAGVDITDTDLVGMGFTRGLRGPANSTVSAGDYFAEPPKIGDYVVTRFYLHTSVAGQFGQPRLYLYDAEPSASFVVPTVWRQISDTVREYFYAGRITQTGRVKWAVGTDNSANASLVTIAGIQFHCGASPAFWIGRADYPSPLGGSGASLLMADDIYLVSDRPLPLFACNGLNKRSLPALVDITNSPAVAAPAPPYFDTGRAGDLLWLDPAAIGSNLKLTMRSDDASHLAFTRTVAVHKKTVPLASPVTRNCAYFGDSHSNGNFSPNLKALLAAWGVDINYYGTLPNDAGETAEGRGGWSLANYIGTRQGAAWTSVVAAGSGATAAYLAGDYTARFNANPFLNNGASGSAAPVISGGLADGYRFDLVNYRTRFALPAIDVVLLNLWSNDMNLSLADGLADVVAYYPVMLAEIRRAWPSAKIICWASAPGYVNPAEIRWTERRQALAAIYSAVKAAQTAGDSNLHLVSAWMHHTVRSGFDLTAGTTVSGVTKARVSDDVHTHFPADLQVHEALAAAIVNLI